MIKIKENIKPYKVLLQNFTSLSILQITNYIFPIITLPYLVRVLGPEKYGLVNFAMAFAAYFVTICDFGFNLSATKQISIFRNDKLKLDEIFSSVIISKMILGIISAAILIAITFSIARFSTDSDIYLLSFGIVIGNILFPIWFFQGIEDMKFITLITFAARLVGTVMIFTIIKDVTDYPFLILIYSLVSIMIGAVGLLVSIAKFKISLKLQGFSAIVFQLREGLQIFVSIAAINLYSTTNIFLLGILVNNTAVGYFAAADKIRTAAQAIVPIISQTVYPHINRLLKESYKQFIDFNKNLLKYQTIITFFISSFLFVFAEEIVVIGLGKEFIDSIWVLKVLATLPFLSSFTTIFTNNYLMPLNLKNELMKTFLIAGSISVVLALVFVPTYGKLATALVFVLGELIAALLSFWFVNRNRN